MKDNTFRLSFDIKENYLYVYLTGQDSFSASLDYWHQIADKVHELGVTRLLVHENLTGQVTEGEIFEVMMDLIPASTGIRVAFYDENRDDQDINALGELVANNRGSDIRIFQSLEAAEEWIQQPEA
ncbi:hypothetical protein P4B35_21475 [Pontiellaceae bacterium B12227]|nr:hypothetical protein [Pontiellaceae bacterium B12227]